MPVLQDGSRRGRVTLRALHEPALSRLLRLAVPVVVIAIGCAPADTADARTSQTKSNPVECRVSRIADGDSFHCGAAGRVRLLMIDAPEIGQGEPGRQARSALETLAPVGTLITIETDVRPRDDYRRLLAYAYLKDGRMINEEMARSGYVTALVFPPNVKYARRIRKAVDDAKTAKRGLWATDFFECLPRDYRAGRCGASPKS